MGAIGRGLRNAFRNKGRAIVLIVIVGIALAVYLSATIVGGSITGQAGTLSQSVANEVTVRPAGSFGGFGGGASTMNGSVITVVEQTPHVTSVQPALTEILVGTAGGRSFALVEGEDPSQPLVLFGGGSLTVTTGRSLDAGDANAMVALIGANYASSNGLGVGSGVSIQGASLTVVGVFDSGTRFGNNAIFIPYEVAASIYDTSGPSDLYVYVDSAGDVNATVSALQSSLGSNYDVVSATTQAQAFQTGLDAIVGNATLASYIALFSAAAVLALVMALVTRERTTEIGLLKAVGFKNSRIVAQFLTEGIALALLGFVAALALTLVLGPTIDSLMLRGGGGFGGRAGLLAIGGFGLRGGGLFTNPPLLAVALLVTVVLGIVGSVYPVWRAIRLKPAEALRHAE